MDGSTPSEKISQSSAWYGERARYNRSRYTALKST
jgi:hypothetical protein